MDRKNWNRLEEIGSEERQKLIVKNDFSEANVYDSRYYTSNGAPLGKGTGEGFATPPLPGGNRYGTIHTITTEESGNYTIGGKYDREGGPNGEGGRIKLMNMSLYNKNTPYPYAAITGADIHGQYITGGIKTSKLLK